MNVRTGQEAEVIKYQVGDAFEIKNFDGARISTCFLVEEPKGYILRGFDGGYWVGFGGWHGDIDALIRKNASRIINHYPSSEYELVLKRKG